MYVFARDTKWTFFIEHKRSPPASYEPVASNDPTMGQPIPLPAQPMAEHGPNKQKLKKKKTKRGKGKGKRRKKENEQIQLSLMGSNSNGLKAKFDSLLNNVNIFSQPNCITLQESKLVKSGIIKLPCYQVFQLNRSVKQGGGLLTAVHEVLDPVLVSAGDDDNEVLVVQMKVGHLNVRVFNAYGPQEDETTASLQFWMGREQEIIKAKQHNAIQH